MLADDIHAEHTNFRSRSLSGKCCSRNSSSVMQKTFLAGLPPNGLRNPRVRERKTTFLFTNTYANRDVAHVGFTLC